MTATTIESPATPSVPFRAADVVKHKPTGEEWILANDQTGTDVSPCGWPECWAEAEHCELVKTATDLERLTMLQNWAQITDSRDQRDHRIHDARTQLEAPSATTAPPAPSASTPSPSPPTSSPSSTNDKDQATPTRAVANTQDSE